LHIERTRTLRLRVASDDTRRCAQPRNEEVGEPQKRSVDEVQDGHRFRRSSPGLLVTLASCSIFRAYRAEVRSKRALRRDDRRFAARVTRFDASGYEHRTATAYRALKVTDRVTCK
jgi:hypothetical protein